MTVLFSLRSLRAGCLLTGLFSVGCVSLTIRDDAKHVFREHNSAASDVMLVLPELDPDAAATQTLIDADRSMLAACEPLNAVALARRDERKITLRQRLRLPPTIEECRAATSSVRELLYALD